MYVMAIRGDNFDNVETAVSVINVSVKYLLFSLLIHGKY